MERKFDLKDISRLTAAHINFYKEEKGFHSVQTSAETSADLNKDDTLRFHAQLTNDAFDVFDSLLLVEGEIQISKDNGVTWTMKADEDITIELNGILKLFKEMSLYSSTDRIIERVSYPGEVSTINQFLMRDYDYPNSEGQLNLFIPDSGTGDHTNSEYSKRKSIVGNKFQVMLSLDSIFGFMTYVRVALSNLNLTLEMQREFTPLTKRQNSLFGNAGADPTNEQFRLYFTRLRWLIPFTRLNAKAKLDFYKQFTKPLHFKFLENRCNYHLVSSGAGDYSFALGNVSSNVHELVVVFKDPTKAFNTNNSKYIQKQGTERLTMIKATIGNINYPAKEFDYKFDDHRIAFPYKYYINAAARNGVTPILSYNDFKNLYTIFYFDLSAQDPSYINLNTPIQITFNKTTNFIPEMYVLLKLEKELLLDFSNSTGSGAKMDTLELISNPNRQ